MSAPTVHTFTDSELQISLLSVSREIQQSGAFSGIPDAARALDKVAEAIDHTVRDAIGGSLDCDKSSDRAVAAMNYIMDGFSYVAAGIDLLVEEKDSLVVGD